MKLFNNLKSNELDITNNEMLIAFLLNNPLNTINNSSPPTAFDKDGKPVSYWHDIKWDYSTDILNYDNKKCIVNFDNYILNPELMNEFKYFVALIYFIKYKNSSPYKIKEIAISSFPFFVAIQSLNYSSILKINDQLNFYSMLNEMKGKYTFKTLLNILSYLKMFSQLEKLYFNLHLNWKKQDKLNNFSINSKELAIKHSKTQSDQVDQTLYIPSKIHSKLIASCIDIINNKINYLPNMIDFLEDDYIAYEKIKKDFNLPNSTGNKESVIFNNLLYKKRDFSKYQLSQFNSIREIDNEIRLLAVSSIILILNFSGMRINEVCNIKSDGFKTINSEPILYIIRSYETKISGGKIADYITSPIVKEAFECLNIIHGLSKKYDSTIDFSALLTTSKHQKLPGYGYIGGISAQLSYFISELNLTIDQDDLKESELLNGPRKNVQIEKLWPLASHQFRRTLIVNFVSHRLGTINAVKQQVKHMYATMTEYYAKNSRLAETFNLNVVKEISDNIEEELLNEGVRQYKDFYYSEEPLAGLKGQEIMNERESIKVLSDDEIKQLFKTGLYKISKSMYGYCTKGNLCDKKEAIDPTFCGANCSTMIITKENADNWQKLYFRNNKLLNSGSKLSIGGIPMNGAKTNMQSQNEVAKKIMDQFNMKYED